MIKKVLQKLVYNFVSYILVFPIFRFVFRGSLEGIENIPFKESFIIVSNHGSLLDPPFLGHALGKKVSFMAKAELFKIPILSQLIIACGAYPIKRGLIDKNSLNTTATKLINKNIVGIFIDGTRQKNGRVNKPKNGAALIAAKTHTKLLPVGIINSHKLVRMKFFIPVFSKVVIKIGRPVSYPLSTSKKDVQDKTDNLQEIINQLLI